MYEQVAEKLKVVDKDLRAEHTGGPTDDIVPAARSALAAMGITLPDARLREYADSISRNVDFNFVLR
jgi:hypothetical protein